MSQKKATYFLSFVFFNLICTTFILSLDAADIGQETKIERENILDNGAATQVLNEKPRYQMPYPATWQILNSGQCDTNIYIYFNDNFLLCHTCLGRRTGKACFISQIKKL